MSALAAPPGELAAFEADQAWRSTMARTATPHEGCFESDYPVTQWKEVSCGDAPADPFGQPALADPAVVGGQNDYAAVASSGLLSMAIGSFPRVALDEIPQDFSLQVNSNFMKTSVCGRNSKCRTWQQFVYSSRAAEAFMQYWLIDYGSACPAGWHAFKGSCYVNSQAVRIPRFRITALADIALSGSTDGVDDTLVFALGQRAYAVSHRDDMLFLTTAWQQAEFNVFGDCCSNHLQFAPGTSLDVQVEVDDGGTVAPACLGRGGTTGETNNLTLGACVGSGGRKPRIRFSESN